MREKRKQERHEISGNTIEGEINAIASPLPEGTYVVPSGESETEPSPVGEPTKDDAPDGGFVFVGEAGTDFARSIGLADPLPPLPHFHMTVDGFFWYESAAKQLLDALPTDRPSAYVEVGVFKGQSLAYLAVEVLNRQLPVTLHAVDTFAGWPGVLQGKALRGEFDKNIAVVAEELGPLLVVHAMSSVQAAATFPDGSVDVVWLDADHSYEAVRADIAAWLPKIRAGGALGGDDWEMGGVKRAVEEAFPSRFTLGDGTRNGARWPWWMVRV